MATPAFFAHQSVAIEVFRDFPRPSSLEIGVWCEKVAGGATAKRVSAREVLASFMHHQTQTEAC